MANNLGQSKWNPAGTVLLAVIAAVIVAVGIGARDGSTPVKDSRPYGITVSGHSEQMVSPNTAYVSLGVTTREKTSRAAVDKNAVTAQAIMKAIKLLGIQPKDIQTRNYSLERWVEYTRYGEHYRGYVVHNTVKITVRDLRKLSDVTDNGVTAGANVVEGVSFGVDDDEGVKREALASAVENARRRAESVAKTLNVKVREPLSVEEPNTSDSSTLYDYDYLQKIPTRPATVAESALPINPSQLKVSQDVVVTFDIR